MRFLTTALSIALVTVTIGQTPAAAQAMSDSYNFIKSVKDGDGAKVQALLAAPGSTVARSRDPGTGESALHIVVKRRDVNWTAFLLQRGVDANAGDKTGETPLGLAARIGFSEGARMLIAGGAQVDGANKRGETPLIIAVQGRRLDMVQLLMRAGANPEKTDSAAGYSARDYAKQDPRAATILRVLDEKRAPAQRKAATSPQ